MSKACTYDLWGSQEALEAAVINSSPAIDNARKRGQPTADKEQERTAAVAKLGELLRSPAHRREMARAYGALRRLPELVLRLAPACVCLPAMPSLLATVCYLSLQRFMIFSGEGGGE